jgi:hypothetical protein
MVMADIWLTVAARSALEKLSPGQAGAVHAAIRDIPSKHGQRFNIPGAPPAEPFLAVEPENPDAPVVIYRRTTTDEQGDWLVVSLMNPGDYHAVRRAEQSLAAAPPAIRDIVNAVVEGAVATVNVNASPGTATTTSGAAPTTVPGIPRRAG